MSNKFKKGDVVNYEGQKTVIIDILKGKETKKPNLQSGILFTGFKRKPKEYVLSNGFQVTGKTLKKHQK